MKVRDLLRWPRRAPLAVRASDELALAQQMMLWGNVRHLPVLDEGGAVVGVLTEHDLLRRRAERRGAGDREPVSSAMSQPAQVAGPDIDVVDASGLMLSRRIGCLPIVEDGRLVGVITRTDLLSSRVEFGAPAGPPQGPRVGAVMRRGVATVTAEQPLLDAVGLMVDRDVRHVPVLSADGRVVGIVSDRDVRTAIGDPMEALQQELEEVDLLTVASVMTTPVITAREDAPLSEVAQRFIDDRVGAIPVVDEGGRLAGIVSYVDVIRALREALRA